MSQNNDKNGELENSPIKGIDRREFIKRTAAGAGAVAVGMVMGGCGTSSSAATASTVAAVVPSKSAWKFAVMNDTQWTQTDDGYNPDGTPVGIIAKLNQEFINKGVKFVVQTGDLTEKASSTGTTTATKTVNGTTTTYTYSNTAAEDMRALFAQTLYNAGIGFFPLRGNHDSAATTATEFQRAFPQAQNGQMNTTPADVLSLTNPDADLQPSPVKTGSAFTVGSNFSSPSSSVNNLKGLSYSFDYNNARFVLLDQFNTVDGFNADGTTAYAVGTTIAGQQSWIDTALAGKPSSGHAFVFSHKGMITEDHVDVLFGSDPSATNSPGLDAFITSLKNNNVGYHFCGHDHMYDRSLVATSDGTTAKVMQIVGASNSSKFYYPASPSNDVTYCSGKRQTLVKQELNTIGYCLVTVDGSHVTVEYYSAPAYPAPVNGGVIATTPTLTFTKRETFGYSLNGTQFVVAAGSAYTTVQDTSTAGSGTVAKVLAGSNGYTVTDPSGRFFSAVVTTGWYAANATASDILFLRGMSASLGSSQTDIFALSLTYDKTKVTDAQIQAGSFALAAPDDSGNWTNAVNKSTGGTKKFVLGAWKSSYPLGTYGVDTTSGTVWAVVNYNGYFAAVAGV
ncbi:metallophosphoesterase [Geobacter sp. FeAm09]|uniref:metallophosphoesterase family protein n=1 Tax=Geobacter sp. FeAm09 TaxID=2597769 RepID=UPI0011EDAE90|nr:metallophosphoesterase [Geobacter sp. FeAm09]QEM66895.1 metallophosphoesterase [Geobacter sp. FeAm09]